MTAEDYARMIPDEALEAAAKAACEYYTGKEWSDVNQGSKGVWRSAARAACLAMLRNWPSSVKVFEGEPTWVSRNAIILPLTENSNDKG